MAYTRVYPAGYVFLNAAGDGPAAAGTITFYDNGTTDLKTVYTTSSGTASSNPLTLGADGRLPNDVYADKPLRVKLLSSAGAQIFQKDDVGVDSEEIEYLAPYTGSAARPIETRLSDWVSVKDFGAVGDGSTNDKTAIQSALDSGASQVFFPAGTYSIATALAVPSNVTAYGRATIKKAGNIDMITLASGASLNELTLDGEGGTYTGRGVVISAGNDQKMRHCTLTDMNGFCLEFASDVGQRFVATDCFFQRTTTDNPAIGFSSSAESAGDRSFIGCNTGGGWLMTTLGSQNTHVVGCTFKNLTIGADTKKLTLSGNRIATTGAVVAVDGIDHSICGNVIAGGITLTAATQSVNISGNTILSTADILDSSTATGNNMNWIWDEYHDLNGTDIGAPTWSASGTAPAIGDGTIDGRYMRSGRMVTVTITLTAGSTTTFGTGTYSFTLPSPHNRTVKDDAVGSVYALDNGTAHYVGAVRVSGGAAPSFTLWSTATTQWGQTVPFTWANTDFFTFTITYEIG